MDNIKLNLPPFYVGQRVVAVVAHSLNMFSKGQEFVVIGLMKSKCCGRWCVDVGMRNNGRFSWTLCNHKTGCRAMEPITDNINWFDAIAFAPLEERFISLAEVIERESLVTSAN